MRLKGGEIVCSMVVLSPKGYKKVSVMGKKQVVGIQYEMQIRK